MSAIQQILKAQAEALQANRDKIAQAEILENAAKILRDQAAKPVVANFKAAFRKSREERLDKFAAAISKRDKEERIAKLAAAGWAAMFGSSDGSKEAYRLKGRQGYKMIVSEGRFSVANGNQVIQSSTSLDNLTSFLNKKI